MHLFTLIFSEGVCVHLFTKVSREVLLVYLSTFVFSIFLPLRACVRACVCVCVYVCVYSRCFQPALVCVFVHRSLLFQTITLSSLIYFKILKQGTRRLSIIPLDMIHALLLFEPCHIFSYKSACISSENSDQLSHRNICVFYVSKSNLLGFYFN